MHDLSARLVRAALCDVWQPAAESLSWLSGEIGTANLECVMDPEMSLIPAAREPRVSQMRTSDSIVELVKALVAARKAFTPVLRDSTAQVGANRTYTYADLAAVLEATMPALLAHGLVVIQAIDAAGSMLITRLVHTSGEWVESDYLLPLEVAPQQLGSALTYGRRYSLQAMLCLAAEDDDGAAAMPAVKKGRHTGESKNFPDQAPSPISVAQRKRLFAIAREHGWTTELMKHYLFDKFGLTSSSDVLVREYDEVCEAFGHPPPVTMAGTEEPF
jgi:hypothetical protein